MEPPRSLLVVGAVTWLLYLIATSVTTWSRLRHIPGPFSAGFSKWWLIRRQMTGKLVLDLQDVCKKYGTAQKSPPLLHDCLSSGTNNSMTKDQLSGSDQIGW